MEKSAEILDIFESFRKGLAAYFSEPAIPKAMKPRHSSVSARIAAALRPYFPAGLSIDIDLKGADILVHDGEADILALFWSSSYLARDRKLRAIAFHEKENPPLTLAFSLFQDRNRFLVYRIEKGYIDYLHIDKRDFSEEVLRRCTIAEGRTADDGQLLLPLRARRKPTSSQGR